MNRRSFAASFALAVWTLLGLFGAPEAEPGDGNGNTASSYAQQVRGAQMIRGDRTVIDGVPIATWALVHPQDDTLLAVGVTFSQKLAEDMPEPGDGPAGAIASLNFPGIVQDTTFLYHLEIQSNIHGHATAPGNVNPNRNAVPHFDFHFYSIPEELVWLIPGQTAPPAPPRVPADLLPAGYTQPGLSLPQMGRHSAPAWSLSDPDFLSTIMLAGFLPDASQMHFLEPMISQDVFLGEEDFTLDVPMPAAFGRAMLYPTRFQTMFNGDSWSLVFSDFVPVE